MGTSERDHGRSVHTVANIVMPLGICFVRERNSKQIFPRGMLAMYENSLADEALPFSAAWETYRRTLCYMPAVVCYTIIVLCIRPSEMNQVSVCLQNFYPSQLCHPSLLPLPIAPCLLPDGSGLSNPSGAAEATQFASGMLFSKWFFLKWTLFYESL